MKKLICFALMLFALSCQKDALIEDRDATDGRNATEEETDSASITPTFDVNGWEGAIDAGFEFGSN